MKVSFSPRALKQLEDILAYIEQDNPGAAARLVGRIEAIAALIARHPGMGRVTTPPNVHVASARPFPYLVFYRVAADRGEIRILRVRHMARG